MQIQILRDRIGAFHQQTLLAHSHHSDDLETTTIQLYRKGITACEISDLIEKMYGHEYCYLSNY